MRAVLPDTENHTYIHYKKTTCQYFHKYRHKNPQEELGHQIYQYIKMTIMSYFI